MANGNCTATLEIRVCLLQNKLFIGNIKAYDDKIKIKNPKQNLHPVVTKIHFYETDIALYPFDFILPL